MKWKIFHIQMYGPTLKTLGIFHIVEQEKLRRACGYSQSHQNHRFLRTQSIDVEEDSVQNLDL